MAAPEPQSQRGVAYRILVELSQLPELDFKAVRERRARSGEEHSPIVDTRSSQFCQARSIRERTGVEVFLPIPVRTAALEAEDDLIPLREVIIGIGESEFFG